MADWRDLIAAEQEPLFDELRRPQNDEPVDARQRRLNRERQTRFRQRRSHANAALWAEAEHREYPRG